MKPERVFEVFDAVSDLPADERDAALAKLCGGDAELRREVEALLASAGEALDQVARDDRDRDWLLRSGRLRHARAKLGARSGEVSNAIALLRHALDDGDLRRGQGADAQIVGRRRMPEQPDGQATPVLARIRNDLFPS